MKKLVAYYCFIITSTMVVLGFLNAQNLPQLIGAVIFYPLALYFTLLVSPKRQKAIHIPKVSVIPVTRLPDQLAPAAPPGFDFDRRMFLKLIGSAGLSVFVFSLFTKRAEAAFFGSVPGPGTVSVKDTTGTKIDPAVKQPTDGYRITEIDDSTTAYYGFVDKTGAWFIQREESSGAYRYSKGTTSFSTNWTNRASLTYDYFDTIF